MPEESPQLTRCRRAIGLFIAGLILACALVIPLALVAGAVRGIPFYWRLIDCSFGVFGVVPLVYALRCVRRAGTAEGERVR
jgi:hypothetical protein